MPVLRPVGARDERDFRQCPSGEGRDPTAGHLGNLGRSEYEGERRRLRPRGEKPGRVRTAKPRKGYILIRRRPGSGRPWAF